MRPMVTHETQSLSLWSFFRSIPFFIEKLIVDAYTDISLTSPLVFTHKFLISLSITHVFALCALTLFLSAQRNLTLSLFLFYFFSLCFLLVLPKEHAFICYSTLPMWAILLCHWFIHAIALQKHMDIQCLLGGRHQLTGNADRPSIFLLCPMHSPHPSFLLTYEYVPLGSHSCIVLPL